ncbi:MAG: hypothetical protein E5Y89_20005 [Mesorhizobium sp.]|nr:MAG: hypothetical protein E5Y89_20005 [Mesorhizobium sp.]
MQFRAPTRLWICTISIYYALIDGGIAAGSWVWGTVSQSHSLTWALEGSAGALLLVASPTAHSDGACRKNV